MRTPPLRSVALITFLVLVWGTTWPVYKLALNDTPPLLFAGMRTLLGGIGLVLVMLPRWREIRWRACWRMYLISCVFNVILFFGLQTVGLTFLPEGLFSVLVYFEPVLVGLLAWLWLHEQISVAKIAGLLLGFFGVAAASAGNLRAGASFTGIAIALITAAEWAVGTVYLKRIQGKADLLWLVAVQFTLGGGVLMGLGLCTERWADIHWTPAYGFGLLYGSVFGVALSWIVWFRLVQSGEASRVVAITFLVPLIAVACGVVFLHEPFNKSLLVGLVLIIAGIWLVNRRSVPRRPRTQGLSPRAL
ncbi:MAG: DMT family transporter [Alicyclobacillus macrosporangiidus]|uniref:DMT family transporter n=1 Tax=Alicyclobacillus macrosporangiidus TaxID=392015 RepID=UPI0026F0F9F2|nr:DMT family transporter [Alicyclobacillus macrosporangiidus]MCL6599679.1 DMT family transporter [Alicyclobacillus macrosporangiidus]